MEMEQSAEGDAIKESLKSQHQEQERALQVKVEVLGFEKKRLLNINYVFIGQENNKTKLFQELSVAIHFYFFSSFN